MTNVKQYIKKPVTVSAIQFNGWNWAECEDFIAGEFLMHPQWMKEEEYVEIKTLEGTMKAMKGDYIIKGVNGEFYPCKQDIFEKTYSLVR